MLEKLLHDHDVLRERAGKLIVLLDLPVMPDPELLGQARWELSGYVMQHLALEDRYVYAKLLADPRPHVRALGQNSQDELKALYTEYARQGQYWTQERIASGWDLYRRPAKKRVLQMLERIDREETELYPLVHDAAINVSTHAPHSTNWARDAFAIKDAMTKTARHLPG